jgi:hypothetical protein
MLTKNAADNMEKPLRGAVLCCTSIAPEQRVCGTILSVSRVCADPE